MARRTGERRIYNAPHQAWATWPIYERSGLVPGARAEGPAIITEPDTTTVVPPDFSFRVDAMHYLVVERQRA